MEHLGELWARLHSSFSKREKDAFSPILLKPSQDTMYIEGLLVPFLDYEKLLFEVSKK